MGRSKVKLKLKPPTTVISSSAPLELLFHTLLGYHRLQSATSDSHLLPRYRQLRNTSDSHLLPRYRQLRNTDNKSSETSTITMGRSKVKLQWINNDAARRNTFKKRKKGLLNKVRELSTLCDVEACAIVYKPGEAMQADVWPDVPEAMRVLSKFNRMPKTKQMKNALNQEGFIRQQIEKMKEQLAKMDMESRDLEMNFLLSDCLEGRRSVEAASNIEDLTCLTLLMELRRWEGEKEVILSLSFSL